MLKYVWKRLREDWRSLNEQKRKEELFSKRTYAIITVFGFFALGLSQHNGRILSSSFISESFLVIISAILFIISTTIGHHSGRYIYLEERKRVDYVPTDNLKDKTRKRRWTITLSLFSIVAALFFIARIFKNKSETISTIIIILATLFSGYTLGMNYYFKQR